MSARRKWSRAVFCGPRPWEATEAAPFNDVPDVSRGEIRLSAEVALAYFNGQMIPAFAHERAVGILKVLSA